MPGIYVNGYTNDLYTNVMSHNWCARAHRSLQLQLAQSGFARVRRDNAETKSVYSNPR